MWRISVPHSTWDEDWHNIWKMGYSSKGMGRMQKLLGEVFFCYKVLVWQTFWARLSVVYSSSLFYLGTFWFKCNFYLSMLLMACEKVLQNVQKAKWKCWVIRWTVEKKKLIINQTETDVKRRFSWLYEVPERSEIGKPFHSNNNKLKREQEGFWNKVRGRDLK